MSSNTVRLNITLPKGLVQTLDGMIDPGKRSRFITEALELRIEQQKKEELNKLLEEGYRATKRESLALAQEFEAADLEGWDEY